MGANATKSNIKTECRKKQGESKITELNFREVKFLCKSRERAKTLKEHV
jgi:hypothetical protein